MTIGVISYNKYLAEHDIVQWGLDDAIVVARYPKSVQKRASELQKIYIYYSEINDDLMAAMREAVGDNIYRLEYKYNEDDWRSPIPLPPVKI